MEPADKRKPKGVRGYKKDGGGKRVSTGNNINRHVIPCLTGFRDAVIPAQLLNVEDWYG
jgi:hypothetical protein